MQQIPGNLYNTAFIPGFLYNEIVAFQELCTTRQGSQGMLKGTAALLGGELSRINVTALFAGAQRVFSVGGHTRPSFPRRGNAKEVLKFLAAAGYFPVSLLNPTSNQETAPAATSGCRHQCKSTAE